MQNYPVSTPYTQTQTVNAPVYPQNTTGAMFNIGMPQHQESAQQNSAGAPSVTNIPAGANGVTINIVGASVNPNGANIYNAAPASAPAMPVYDPNYYMKNFAQQAPTVPIGASNLNDTNKKEVATKNIVLLTDDYIKTLENYIRNDNPDIKLMGAKELMKRFREDESRKNDPALTSLLNLTLQSRYSPVKMVGMGILQNGWAQGDGFTQQLLSQIQQSKTGYGLDALDAADAALKTAGKTMKVVDNNPPKAKDKK